MNFLYKYLKIIIPGHIFTSLSYAYTNIMRASGHPMIAMNTLIMGALLNVLLDPIFIFWFNLGIKGAAYATVLSMLISCLWIMHYFFRKDNTLSFWSMVNSQQSTVKNNNNCAFFAEAQDRWLCIVHYVLSIEFSFIQKINQRANISRMISISHTIIILPFSLLRSIYIIKS